MTTNVCFVDGTTCGISAEMAKAPLVCGRQFGTTSRKPEAVTKARLSSNKLLPVVLDITRKGPTRDGSAALLPIVAVAFTVGGPMVYQPQRFQFANE